MGRRMRCVLEKIRATLASDSVADGTNTPQRRTDNPGPRPSSFRCVAALSSALSAGGAVSGAPALRSLTRPCGQRWQGSMYRTEPIFPPQSRPQFAASKSRGAHRFGRR